MVGQALKASTWYLGGNVIDRATTQLLSKTTAVAGSGGPADGWLLGRVQHVFLRPAVEGCGLVFAPWQGLHQECLDRDGAVDAGQADHAGRSDQRGRATSGHSGPRRSCRRQRTDR